jgi:hypothetical protein
MSIERSKALIIALHNIWNTGNLEKIPEVYSPACMVHWPHGWGPGSRGHAQIKKAIAYSRTVFPDWHEEILDLVVTQKKVVTRYLSSGTHQGEYLGISATGRKIEFEEISIYRIEANRVVEQWCLGDDMHCIAQLTSENS